MAAANSEVSDNMATLAGSVAESASSIEEMTFSIKEVAKNIEELSAGDGVPTAAQQERLDRADRRLALAGRIDLPLLLLAALTMAVARYL